MKIYKVGYLIGSLSSTSINRKLARALVKLAPPSLSSPNRVQGLSIYSQDFDATIHQWRRRSKPIPPPMPCFRHARFAIRSRRPEKRDRLGKPPGNQCSRTNRR